MITTVVALIATVVGNVGLIWWKWNDPTVLAKVAASKQQQQDNAMTKHDREAGK